MRKHNDINQLILKALEGDQRSYSALYNYLMPFVKSIIKRKIFKIGRYEASEIAHEQITKIFLKLNQFDLKRNFNGWVFVIVSNAVIDMLRSKKQTELSIENFFQGEGEDAIPLQIPSQDTDAESKLIQKSKKELLYNLIDKTLSSKRKNLLLDKYIGDKTLKQLSEKTGMPVPTCSTELLRGRRQLLNKILKSPFLLNSLL